MSASSQKLFVISVAPAGFYGLLRCRKFHFVTLTVNKVPSLRDCEASIALQGRYFINRRFQPADSTIGHSRYQSRRDDTLLTVGFSLRLSPAEQIAQYIQSENIVSTSKTKPL